MIDLKAIFGDRVALMATIAILPTVAAEGNALDNGLGGLQDDWHDEEVAIETLPLAPRAVPWNSGRIFSAAGTACIATETRSGGPWDYWRPRGGCGSRIRHQDVPVVSFAAEAID